MTCFPSHNQFSRLHSPSPETQTGRCPNRFQRRRNQIFLLDFQRSSYPTIVEPERPARRLRYALNIGEPLLRQRHARPVRTTANVARVSRYTRVLRLSPVTTFSTRRYDCDFVDIIREISARVTRRAPTGIYISALLPRCRFTTARLHKSFIVIEPG